MKQMIHKMYHPMNPKLGLLVLRLTLGGLFLYHGIQKLENMHGTIAFFATVGIAAFWAWVVALIETIGGAAVILGIGTRIWASLFAIIMIVAIVSMPGGFMAKELLIAYLGLSLGLGLIGCGKWSMCRMWHKGTCNTGDEHCGCDCPEKK